MSHNDDWLFGKETPEQIEENEFFDMMLDQKLSKQNPPTPRSRSQKRTGDISTGATIISMIGGLVALGTFVTMLGIEVDDMPVALILILWFTLTLLISFLFRRK
jgi:hypothetical protein